MFNKEILNNIQHGRKERAFKHAFTEVFSLSLPVCLCSDPLCSPSHIHPHSTHIWLLLVVLQKGKTAQKKKKTCREKQAKMQLCVEQQEENTRKAKRRETERTKSEKTAMGGKTS